MCALLPAHKPNVDVQSPATSFSFATTPSPPLRPVQPSYEMSRPPTRSVENRSEWSNQVGQRGAFWERRSPTSLPMRERGDGHPPDSVLSSKKMARVPIPYDHDKTKAASWLKTVLNSLLQQLTLNGVSFEGYGEKLDELPVAIQDSVLNYLYSGTVLTASTDYVQTYVTQVREDTAIPAYKKLSTFKTRFMNYANPLSDSVNLLQQLQNLRAESVNGQTDSHEVFTAACEKFERLYLRINPEVLATDPKLVAHFMKMFGGLTMLFQKLEPIADKYRDTITKMDHKPTSILSFLTDAKERIADLKSQGPLVPLSTPATLNSSTTRAQVLAVDVNGTYDYGDESLILYNRDVIAMSDDGQACFAIEVMCSVCGQKGHVKRNCKLCYNCRKSTEHFAKDCPEPLTDRVTACALVVASTLPAFVP